MQQVRAKAESTWASMQERRGKERASRDAPFSVTGAAGAAGASPGATSAMLAAWHCVIQPHARALRAAQAPDRANIKKE